MRYKANGLIWIRRHTGVSHDQIPVAARFVNADLHNVSSGCDTTNMQLFFPNLLHDVTNSLGHTTYITNECSSTKWLPAPSHSSVIPPNVDQIFILASDIYHATRDCYLYSVDLLISWKQINFQSLDYPSVAIRRY